MEEVEEDDESESGTDEDATTSPERSRKGGATTNPSSGELIHESQTAVT